MSIYEKQNIDFAFPNLKQALIDYARNQYVKALHEFNVESDDGEQKRKADIYSETLGDIKNFPELEEEILKRISRIVSDYLAHVGTSLKGMSKEKIKVLETQVNDAHFVFKDDVHKTFESVEKIIDELEKKIVGIEQASIEKMEEATRKQTERKPIKMTDKLQKKMELSGGKPVVLEINGQQVVATQEAIINSSTNELEMVYMCRSQNATEMMNAGNNNIVQINYDGWGLCLTDEEHNAMFPEAVATMNEFVAKYADKSPYDIEESMETIAQMSSTQPVHEGVMEVIAPDSTGQSIEEDTMESISPQSIEATQKAQVIERDGQKYVITKEAEYDEQGQLVAPGEIRTVEAMDPKTGYVVLPDESGTFNRVLTPEQFLEYHRTKPISRDNPRSEIG